MQVVKKSGFFLVASALMGLSVQIAQAENFTGIAGNNIPFSTQQPSLALTNFIQTTGIYPARESPFSVGEAVLGSIRTFAGNFAPGSVAANGQLFSISSNTALFSLLGTNFGGNGINNFALPDLRGKTMIGSGAGPGLSNRAVGEQVGSATNSMTIAQLPVHTHTDSGAGNLDFGPAGGGQPINNMQPSLGVSYVIALDGYFPQPGVGGTDGPFVGQVSAFAGNFAPGGYAFADGSVLSIADNISLFSVIGTTYGGDGANTFALPDLRGRTIIGAGQGLGLTLHNIGDVVGAEQVTLNQQQMPIHTHTVVPNFSNTNPAGGILNQNGLSTSAVQPIDNMQPSLALNYLIATQGIYPSRDGGVAGETLLGEVTAFAGNYAPGGWAFADGRLLSIAQNQALFSLLGTSFGGDGRLTFALPDLRGRIIVGAEGSYNLGQTNGTEKTSLNPANLASHQHSITTVPLPQTFTLMLAGLGVFGVLAQRRKQNAVTA
ncbi:MAG: tail fiber protein [Methylococcaceae bacterium]|nr:tail fiber protein [Methylococcaceae bacterium]MDP3905371.1 tail fiber protein [Methylococcaceae bacterium]